MEKSQRRAGAASDLLPSFLFFPHRVKPKPLPLPPHPPAPSTSGAEACLFKRNPPLLINPLTPQKMRAEIKRGQEREREARCENRSRINTFSFFSFFAITSLLVCFMRLLGKQLRLLCHFVSAHVSCFFFFNFDLKMRSKLNSIWTQQKKKKKSTHALLMVRAQASRLQRDIKVLCAFT